MPALWRPAGAAPASWARSDGSRDGSMSTFSRQCSAGSTRCDLSVTSADPGSGRAPHARNRRRARHRAPACAGSIASSPRLITTPPPKKMTCGSKRCNRVLAFRALSQGDSVALKRYARVRALSWSLSNVWMSSPLPRSATMVAPSASSTTAASWAQAATVLLFAASTASAASRNRGMRMA
jgi:hypothetical protein